MKAADLFDVTGRVVFVTGGASGIGLAISEVMAANGARVVMADIDAASLARESARLGVDAVKLDVSNAGEITKAVDDAVARHDRLDVMFANAGISGGSGHFAPNGKIEDAPPDLWKRVLDVNLTGAFLTMQAAARHMRRQRRGSIIVTSSIAAVRPSGVSSYGYVATKAAVANMVRLAAQELGPDQIRVNGIAPGPFVTNIAGGRLRDPEAQKVFLTTVPLGRAAQPDEIKGLALFLASDASSYVTGGLIAIDGGTAA